MTCQSPLVKQGSFSKTFFFKTFIQNVSKHPKTFFKTFLFERFQDIPRRSLRLSFQMVSRHSNTCSKTFFSRHSFKMFQHILLRFQDISLQDVSRHPNTVFKMFLFKTFQDIPRRFLRNFSSRWFFKRFQDNPI